MSLIETGICIYVFAAGIATLLVFGIDKRNAILHRYRVPERILLGMSLIGGSIGAITGMYLFHHKTRKPLFYISVPLMVLLHIALIIYAFQKL